MEKEVKTDGSMPSFTINSIMCTICSTRVSNELGAGNAQAAKRAVYVVMSMSAFQATIVGTVLVALRFHWGWMYSSETEVVQYVGTIIPFLACIFLFDGIQGVLSGMLESQVMKSM